MYSQPNNIQFNLPEWLTRHTKTYVRELDLNKRMEFVIEASRLNVELKTGGPFAAAVFERESGKLISLGVNLVIPQRLSLLHAEVVAITIAQRKLNTHDLGGDKLPQHELFTSTEPCSMCLGASHWSGVGRVVTAATGSDAELIGFDEGPKPADWVGALQERNVEVVTEVSRDLAKSVLARYKFLNPDVYRPAHSAH